MQMEACTSCEIGMAINTPGAPRQTICPIYQARGRRNSHVPQLNAIRLKRVAPAPENMPLMIMLVTVQGVATSIDALSVGFTISEYGWLMALAASLIIAVVTFFICMAGLRIGKKFGTKLSGKASILGGMILIGIGLEIFISGVF